MKRDFRIKITHEIDKKYFPVIAFFNAIPDYEFIGMLEYMLKGIGYTFNEVHCEFPGDLDPGDKMFEGIRFTVLNDEIVIDYQTLYHFIELSCKAYIEDNYVDMAKIDKILCRFKESIVFK